MPTGQTFSDEQVPGGGDGQELGDAFDDAEQNREEPFRHGQEGVDEVMECESDLWSIGGLSTGVQWVGSSSGNG